MSGIVGILNLNGAPIDRELLGQMTGFLAYRGPDAQGIWSEGSVGFGHAMLRSTWESQSEKQPLSLDGQVWITADARVDGRAELIGKLQSKGCHCDASATDAALILHAYEVWGEDCVQHLLGDFAFAIWDGPSRRLFCARDHFGVKPFYYARVADCLVFSNTLNCVRLHSGVSGELDDQAIGDFLLLDFNQDPATTTFAGICRLPPAHTLILSPGSLQVRRYWTLPVEEPICYRRAGDYVEHFRALLGQAVEDRLRTNRVGVFMSGGLDSTGVAAMAKECLSKLRVPYDLRAYSAVLDRLFPDQERHFVGLAAEALGTPVEYLAVDDYTLYERWDQPELRTPEPVHDPLAAATADQLRQAAACHRVVLTGYGGDPALSASMSSYIVRIVRGLKFGRLLADLGRFAMAEGRISRLYLRTRLRVLFNKNGWRQWYPSWLNEDFARRQGLPARWEQVHRMPALGHPHRPEAYQALLLPFWQRLFEDYDPGAIHLPVESRYPFFDLRLVKYLLRVPPVPWCTDKEVLRVAMRGVLPDQVRLRRKTPLSRDPFVARVRRGDTRSREQFAPAPGLANYVDWERVPFLTGKEDSRELWLKLRPVSFNLWLQSGLSANYKFGTAGGCGITGIKIPVNDAAEAAATGSRRQG